MHTRSSSAPLYPVRTSSIYRISNLFHHLVTARGREAQVHLEAIVDEPLERGKSTDHDDTDRQAVPETREADVAVDARHGLSGALAGLAVAVELRYHDVYSGIKLASKS